MDAVVPVSDSSAAFDFDGAIYAQGAKDGAAAERERIRAYVTERISELAAMGWPGQGETVPQSELRNVLDLLAGDAP